MSRRRFSSSTLRARLALALSLVAGVGGLLACGDGERSSGAEAAPIQPLSVEEFADPELEAFTGDLDAMRARRLIRALVTPSLTDFFVDSGQIRGIQAEFLREFAARLNQGRSEAQKIRIKYVPVAFGELIPALRAGRGDIAAAFLTVTEERSEGVRFTAPLRREVSEVIVTHVDADPPETLEDLSGRRLYVLHGSSYAEHLRALDARLRAEGQEGLEIEEADPFLRSEDILELVNAGVVEATAIDDYKADLWAPVLPGIRVHRSLALSEGNRVAWAVRSDSTQLQAAIDRFAREAREGALLGNILLDRYFGSDERLRNPTGQTGRDRLRRYMHLFEKYGERFDIDPLALAAQAFQESRLDHGMRSAAGAVGLMQVLPSTAADPRVGIADVSQPDANVHAGAKYLAFVRDHYFDDPELDEWNRRAFAWAAYNAGPRKIREARTLARQLGLDDDVWFGNVEVATARVVGREPVRYVANIHRYFVAYRLYRAQERQRREVAEELG